MDDPILEMRGVSKSFFGIKALRAVDLTVYAGEIHVVDPLIVERQSGAAR